MIPRFISLRNNADFAVFTMKLGSLKSTVCEEIIFKIADRYLIEMTALKVTVLCLDLLVTNR